MNDWLNHSSKCSNFCRCSTHAGIRIQLILPIDVQIKIQIIFYTNLNGSKNIKWNQNEIVQRSNKDSRRISQRNRLTFMATFLKNSNRIVEDCSYPVISKWLKTADLYIIEPQLEPGLYERSIIGNRRSCSWRFQEVVMQTLHIATHILRILLSISILVLSLYLLTHDYTYTYSYANITSRYTLLVQSSRNRNY